MIYIYIIFAGNLLAVYAASEFFHLPKFSRWVKKECSISTVQQHKALMDLKAVMLEIDVTDFSQTGLISRAAM